MPVFWNNYFIPYTVLWCRKVADWFACTIIYGTIYEIYNMFKHCSSFLLYGKVNNISYLALNMLGYLTILYM